MKLPKEFLEKLRAKLPPVPAPKPAPIPAPPSTVGLGNCFDAANGDYDKTVQAQVDFVAERNLICIQKGPTGVAALKTLNPNAIILYYSKFNGVKTDDALYQYCKDNDLFFKDSHGAICINPVNKWAWVDIITPSKRDLWFTAQKNALQDVLMTQGYMGLRFDNCEVLTPLIEDLISAIPANYDQAKYFAAIGDLLTRWKAAFPQKTFLFNSYYATADAQYRGPGLLQYCDGMYFEGFSFKFSGAFQDVSRYDYMMADFAKYSDSKAMVSIDYVNASDVQRRSFSAASYLLTCGAKSSFVLFGNDTQGITDWSEYKIDIGTPIAPYVNELGLYKRTFSNGKVVVNPSADQKSYLINGNKMLYAPTGTSGSFPNNSGASWKTVTGTLSLAPHTAAILKNG